MDNKCTWIVAEADLMESSLLRDLTKPLPLESIERRVARDDHQHLSSQLSLSCFECHRSDAKLRSSLGAFPQVACVILQIARTTFDSPEIGAHRGAKSEALCALNYDLDRCNIDQATTGVLLSVRSLQV